MSIVLKDIANSTGYSLNTVSRVLRGDKKISKSTSELIKSKADELGYIPNALASGMRNSTSNIIGVISVDSSNPFFSSVIKGIEYSASKNGYNILLANTEESTKKETELLKMFLTHKVAGIISMPIYDSNPQRIEQYKNIPVPFIFTGRYIEGFKDHSVLHDDYENQKMIIKGLIKNGHKKIFYIAGPDNASNSYARKKGVIDAFEENGLTVNTDYIISSTGHIEEGYAIINRALYLGLEFSAVVCFNDLIAMGVLKSLYENNFKVPKDIEVFGFDNIYSSQFLNPSLSTVDVPKFRLGKIAMEELIKHIKDPDLKYSSLEIPTRIIYRESSKNKN
jgi:LacI family transcriptional regulator